MLIEAVVTLTDYDSGADLSVLVEAEVTLREGAEGWKRFERIRAVGMEWVDLSGGRPATRADEGTQALRGLAQDLVDARDNQWRVCEALAAAYDTKMGVGQ